MKTQQTDMPVACKRVGQKPHIGRFSAILKRLYSLIADGNGTAYSYTSDGKLATRTWARGITTTYSYTNTGEMVGIVYSDTNTPAITFTHTRIGQQKTVTDAEGTRTFSYSPTTLALTSEVIVANGVTNVITRTQDGLGRASGISLNSDYSVAYTYTDVGRFGSVSSLVSSVSCVTDYSYLTNSDLLAGYELSMAGAASPVTVAKSYEDNRNLITSVANSFGTNLVSQFDYLNDAVGRRTQRIDAGTSVATNDFVYSPKSELISADMGGSEYDYTFDPIGNRIEATEAGSEWDYIANALNQYTSITNDGSPIAVAHDADGNMITNGDWTYFWSGENRLVGASNSEYQISFSYDYMGRRFRKVVNGVTNNFIYDGWAMIHEDRGGVENSYVYGLDLSGSIQGAGTIGGILSGSLNGTNVVYFYDANGNCSDLADTTGSTVAHYEYSPFGQLAASSGALKDANPWQFSTKYYDAETQFKYYGFRYLENGRWISRDPIGERGGPLLYGYCLNDPIDFCDAVGQMTWQEVTDVKKLMQLIVDTLFPDICCCEEEKGPTKAMFDLAGTSSGATVTGTVTDKSTGCYLILEYFWWNCYDAVNEGGSNSRDQGWSPGGSSFSTTKKPGWIARNIGINWPFDPLHIAMNAEVLVVVCHHGTPTVLLVPASPELVWEWDRKKDAWK